MSYLNPVCTYERKDKACFAEVLVVSADQVLFLASWPATARDKRSFRTLADGRAVNCLSVSKRYFQEKYGVSL